MQGRLNAIQKSMLQWNAMHPYNAVHVLQARGELDILRLRAVINATLEKHHLTRLVLDGRRFAFEYQGGPADAELQTLAGGPDAWSALVPEIERQLNLPFDFTRPFSPFRFLVAPSGDSYFLGLAYFHPVADAESVVLLIKDIVGRYGNESAAASNGAFELYPESRSHLLSRHMPVLVRKILASPAQAGDLRRAHRPVFRDANDMANGLVCFSLGAEELGSLVAAASSWGVAVNDLFLALLLKCLSPLAAARIEASKRRKISLGCIVNLRRDFGMASKRVFGVFLGSFTVTHETPQGITVRTLAGQIRGQTAGIKRHKLYLALPLELAVGRFALRFFSPARQKRFYAKHYPLWGGITNMNLNRLWDPSGPNAPLDYLRGVSTGPVTPLVLSATTFRDRVNLAVSYRATVFSKSDITDLQRRFHEHLDEIRQEL